MKTEAHNIDEDTEAQRDKTICPSGFFLGFKPRTLPFSAGFLVSPFIFGQGDQDPKRTRACARSQGDE